MRYPDKVKLMRYIDTIPVAVGLEFCRMEEHENHEAHISHEQSMKILDERLVQLKTMIKEMP